MNKLKKILDLLPTYIRGIMEYDKQSKLVYVTLTNYTNGYAQSIMFGITMLRSMTFEELDKKIKHILTNPVFQPYFDIKCKDFNNILLI